MNRNTPTAAPPPEPAPLSRVTNAAAVVSAMAFIAALALRPVGDTDVGYHLAYGERFLATGHIVDDEEFLYRVAPDARPDPGPGNWYDEQGRYRFPNANWLSQIAMAALYRLGGMTALSIASAVLIVAIVTGLVLLMRFLEVPWPLAAAGIVLLGLAAYERFDLRPEVFGYLMMIPQLVLLAEAARPGRSLTLRRGLVLVGLQLLLVNLHSYFALGLMLTGAFLADRLAHWGWSIFVPGPDPNVRARLGRQARLLAAILAAQGAVCFINPWTWRLVALPVQTTAYLRQNNIVGTSGPTAHPWGLMAEMNPLFAEQGRSNFQIATTSFKVVLALAALTVPAALARRRWAWLILLAVMAAAAFPARRNIGIASMVMLPPALACLWPAARWLAPARLRRFPFLPHAAALLVAAAAGGLTFWVVSGRFYRAEGTATRFGAGPSPARHPIAAADWISQHNPAGLLWTDIDSSSNMLFWTRPHRSVPVLTNTWAYPPAVMSLVFRCSLDPDLFEQIRKARDIQLAVLHLAPGINVRVMKLPRALADNPNWPVVCLSPPYVLFLRADGPNRALAAASALRPSPIAPDSLKPAPWLADYIRRWKQDDALPAPVLAAGGWACQALGWHNEAVELFRQSLDIDAGQPAAWNQLGSSYIDRAILLEPRKPDLQEPHRLKTPAAREQAQLAADAFAHALKLHLPTAEGNLRLARSLLQDP